MKHIDTPNPRPALFLHPSKDVAETKGRRRARQWNFSWGILLGFIAYECSLPEGERP